MKANSNTFKLALTICLCMVFTMSFAQKQQKVVGSRPSAEAKANQLSIHPNPAGEEVSLDVPIKKQKGFDLEIHSKQGTLVLSQKWNGEKIDVSQFQSGIYIVTLRKGQQYYSQKLVVKRE